jgi:alkanesulfonate monooxygenase SsuD/methylene tetrahydromethanopterin reductase-like flavin-dependent oxidoreductase (luciferase family)
MRFCLLEDFRNPPRWRRPWADLYADLLDQVVRAEELGYHEVWLTEHHFTEDGYNPAILTTAAAIAARTSRIRIGSFVLVLPFHDPIRVAEDATCVDIVSRGRLDLGIGQGYTAPEFEAFGVPRGERTARMREGVQLIRRLWTEDRVTVQGRFRSIRELRLEPRPVQQPHPPIWIGARTEKAVRWAAASGFHLLTTLGPDPAPAYLATLREAGRDPDAFFIGQLRLVYVAESEDEAWEDVAEHIQSSMQYYAVVLAEAGDVRGDDRVWPFERASDIRHSPIGRAMMVGTPDGVARKLQHFVSTVRCTHLILNTQLPGLPPARATRSLELFAREVMPQFSKGSSK